MMILTIEELENQGVPRKESKESSTIKFSNKIFTRGADFSQQARQAAINFAKEYLKSKIVSLIVDHQMYLTVWVEREDANLQSKTASFTKTNVTSNDKGISPRSQFQSEQLVQTPRQSTRFADNQPSTDVASSSVASTPMSSDTSISPKDTNKFNTLSDIESSQEQQASVKKRSRRRYRGISY